MADPSKLDDCCKLGVYAWRSAWSRTVFKRARDEDYTMQTRGRLLDRLRFMLAGRAAEALYLKAKPVSLLLLHDFTIYVLAKTIMFLRQVMVRFQRLLRVV